MSNNFLMRHQDQMVGGVFRLGAVVQRSALGIIYETEFGEEARPAVIKFRFVENPGAENLVPQWQNAIGLTHPNLLQVYAAGFSELDGAPVVYVVMERADASLAGVLLERTLSEGEIREILAPTLSALNSLHKNGYAHTAVKPSNILAVGDQVKLSGDNPWRIEDGADPAEDVRAVGIVIVQSLTRELTTDSRKLLDASGSLSEPFKEIAQHCLDPDRKKRWSLDQVQARLDGRAAAPAPTAVPVRAPAPTPVKVQEIRAVPAPAEARVDATVAAATAVDAAAVNGTADAPPSRSTPKWIFTALAALIVIVLLGANWRKQHAAPAAVAPVWPIAASWPTAPEAKTPRPSAIPEPEHKPSPVAPPVRESRRGTGWSVVVGTYGSHDAAEKRQRELARRWPKFSFSVFQQPTEKAQYLIVAGQNLSEDEADSLRKRAVASGIPSDTYIKKFP